MCFISKKIWGSELMCDYPPKRGVEDVEEDLKDSGNDHERSEVDEKELER